MLFLTDRTTKRESTRSMESWTLQNDFGFSLYAMLSIYHGITTSKERTEFKRWVLIRKYVTIKYQSLVFNNIQLSDWRCHILSNFIQHPYLFIFFQYRLCFISINSRTKPFNSFNSIEFQIIIWNICSSSIIKKNFLYLRMIVTMWIFESDDWLGFILHLYHFLSNFSHLKYNYVSSKLSITLFYYNLDLRDKIKAHSYIK